MSSTISAMDVSGGGATNTSKRDISQLSTSTAPYFCLERSLLQTPQQRLSKNFRNTQKLAEKHLQTIVRQSDKHLQQHRKRPLSRAQCVKALQQYSSSLSKLASKLSSLQEHDIGIIDEIHSRLIHLDEVDPANPNALLSSASTSTATSSELSSTADNSLSLQRWEEIRLQRLLVEYMYRDGCHRSAALLAKEVNIENLVDSTVYAHARTVISALEQHSCSSALHWCAAHRSNLRKLENDLEFELRSQEYIELVRKNSVAEAIAYARQHLSPHSASRLSSLVRLFGLLAFARSNALSHSDPSHPYQDLFSDERYIRLISLFQIANYRVHGLALDPQLSIFVRAGLSALKTPDCASGTTHNKRQQQKREDDEEGRGGGSVRGEEEPSERSLNQNCPVCSKQLGLVAEDLPLAFKQNSSLVCRITGRIMDVHNPPLVLPNGNAYSTEAIDAMGSVIVCPRTGDTFERSALTKAYIT
eukprot:CAMPEP_0177633696 /NCGR_PEP_ID=MMETSP0447-20121125/2975_1 /TAXON_ID=0 /ORGANISM="Stygamoeba regulata, Strain BSH-02190019" /LENGTH=473 /DNA_ID=CAMNT_0019135373 /DNA_START=108 /DNA_END=1529 /DNA_ORIENTATION=+